MENVFVNRTPVVEDNLELREPQREGYLEIANQVAAATIDREVGIILPVGCGKSGLITLTPFAYGSRRALVVAPNVKIYDQLAAEFDPANRAACKTPGGLGWAQSSALLVNTIALDRRLDILSG